LLFATIYILSFLQFNDPKTSVVFVLWAQLAVAWMMSSYCISVALGLWVVPLVGASYYLSRDHFQLAARASLGFAILYFIIKRGGGWIVTKWRNRRQELLPLYDVNDGEVKRYGTYRQVSGASVAIVA